MSDASADRVDVNIAAGHDLDTERLDQVADVVDLPDRPQHGIDLHDVLGPRYRMGEWSSVVGIDLTVFHIHQLDRGEPSVAPDESLGVGHYSDGDALLLHPP